METLLGGGLRTVIDMRSDNEVETAPNPFATLDQVKYHNIGLFDHLAPDTMRDTQTQRSGDPLLDFYTTTLANRQDAICKVLIAIATAQSGTVMFHCTAGKDRTGLISALLLGLVEVEEEKIVLDYARTKPLIADLVQEFLDLARKNGTNLQEYRPFLACDPETMRNVVKHISYQYKSVSDYLTEIGLGADIKGLLKRRLLS